MAIKGYLSEITFVELLKVIGHHNGKLCIWNLADNKQYECFFYDRSVLYLNFGGKAVTDQDAVKDVFLELLTDCKSYYVFEDTAALPEHHSPIVSVKELLDFSVFETPEATDDLLPHINTKFETVNKFDFVLQGELGNFWRDSISLLHNGCSAYDLCIEFGLEENLVRQNLYKLRTTGLIKPVRMFSLTTSLARAAMLRKNPGSFANGINGAQEVRSDSNEKGTDTNGWENGQAIDIRSSQDDYSNDNSLQTQVDQYQQSFLAETAAPPDFLLKNNQPISLPETCLSVYHGTQPQIQHSPVDSLIDLQQSEPFNEADVTQNPFGSGAQSPSSADEFPVTPAVHSVNFSTNNSNTTDEKFQKDDKDLLVPKRSNLIKRMLSSLFRG